MPATLRVTAPAAAALLFATGLSAAPIDPANLAETAKLSFSEEFDVLDLRKGGRGRWSTSYWWADGRGASLDTNGEMQWHIDAEYPATKGIRPWSVRDGILRITADVADPGMKTALGGRGYTSGILTTFRSFRQQEGYFEARIRVPKGRGLWPAVWLLPADRAWPPEIDLVEVLGHDPATAYATVHWGTPKSHKKRQGRVKVPRPGAFQVWGLLWEKDHLAWFLNGRKVFEARTPPGMDRPMYLLVNLAIGGHWAGPPDTATVFPATFEVDYIRAWTAR